MLPPLWFLLLVKTELSPSCLVGLQREPFRVSVSLCSPSGFTVKAQFVTRQQAVPCSELLGFSCIVALISESLLGARAADFRSSHQAPHGSVCTVDLPCLLPRVRKAPSACDVHP